MYIKNYVSVTYINKLPVLSTILLFSNMSFAKDVSQKLVWEIFDSSNTWLVWQILDISEKRNMI